MLPDLSSLALRVVDFGAIVEYKDEAALRERARFVDVLPDIDDGGVLKPTCVICHDPFVSGRDVDVLHCGHAFHLQCLENWLYSKPGRSACPACRTTMLPPEFEELNLDVPPVSRLAAAIAAYAGAVSRADERIARIALRRSKGEMADVLRDGLDVWSAQLGRYARVFAENRDLLSAEVVYDRSNRDSLSDEEAEELLAMFESLGEEMAETARDAMPSMTTGYVMAGWTESKTDRFELLVKLLEELFVVPIFQSAFVYAPVYPPEAGSILRYSYIRINVPASEYSDNSDDSDDSDDSDVDNDLFDDPIDKGPRFPSMNAFKHTSLVMSYQNAAAGDDTEAAAESLRRLYFNGLLSTALMAELTTLGGFMRDDSRRVLYYDGLVGEGDLIGVHRPGNYAHAGEYFAAAVRALIEERDREGDYHENLRAILRATEDAGLPGLESDDWGERAYAWIVAAATTVLFDPRV